MILAAGARLWYLSPYSPDLKPIEQAFSKREHWMRRAQKRTFEDNLASHRSPHPGHPAPRMRQLFRQRRLCFSQNV